MNAQDLEAVWNRIAITQARTARLVEGWLPPLTSSSSSDINVSADPNTPANAKAEEALHAELQSEDYSDTAGIGYRPASMSLGGVDGSGTPRRALTSNERLRSLLLGSSNSSQMGRHQAKVAPSSRPTQALMGTGGGAGSGSGTGTGARIGTGMGMGSEAASSLSSSSSFAAKRSVNQSQTTTGSGRWARNAKVAPAPKPNLSDDDEDLGRSAIGRKRAKKA